ncbi:MAG: hypothetical protein U9M92_02050 [Patescibacteria group bacterium]|nr:hypothetical protein [Patescibacteria group bacterium]
MNKQRGGAPLIIITIILLLIGGGAYAYFAQPESFNKVTSVFRSNSGASAAEAKMWEGIWSLKTLTYQQEIGLRGEVRQEGDEKDEPLSGDVKINANGQSDWSDLDNIKSSVQVTAELTSSNELASFKVGGESRTIDGITYVKIGQFPLLAAFGASFLSDRWIKIDRQDLEDRLGVDHSIENMDEKTKEIALKLIGIWKEEKVISLGELIDSGNIDGEATWHYAIDLDKDSLKRLIARSFDLLVTEYPSEYTVESQQDKAEVLAIIGRVIDTLPDLVGDIWLAKSDYLPHKMNLEMVFDNTQLWAGDPEDVAIINGTVNFSASFNNHNEPVNIEAPSDGQTIQEVLGAMFGESFGTMSEAFSDMPMPQMPPGMPEGMMPFPIPPASAN